MKTLLSLATTAIGLAVAALILIGASILVQGDAQATPAFSQQTGFGCSKCHASPAGGKLNSYGNKFQANGNKVPGK
jgi:hypothetical protein